MIVFCDGIAAVGEKGHLDRFQKYSKARGKEVNIYHFGKILLEIAREDYPEIGKYDLMRYPVSTVKAWRSAAFENILNDIERDEVNIVDSHASFWIKSGPEPAINMNYLNKLDPDMYVQIEDYCVDIWNRLQGNEDLPEEDKLTLEEVLRWQEVEKYTNTTLAKFHNKPFYLIARKQPPSTLYNLIFEDRISIYQSYPITHLKEGELEEIEDHIEKLRERATVFDPGTIKINEGDLGGDEKLLQLVSNFVTKRDERLIDQSDMFIAKFPRMVYSSGVEYEINYASKKGKPVWIVKPEEYSGPFTEYNCDRSFSSTEECLEALKEVSSK